MKKWILVWFRWRVTKSGKRILAQDFNPKKIEQILNRYWQRYLALKPDVPGVPTVGGQIMLQLAAMSTAFYSEIILWTKDEKKSTQLFYDIAWEVYKKMGSIAWKLTRWKKKSNMGRLTLATKFFRKFPFGSPSYVWIDQPSVANAACFNCVKCPVADYFKTKNLSEFCAETWCAFDFELAELWNGRLERSGSIAGGAELCDFKWISKDAQE